MVNPPQFLAEFLQQAFVTLLEGLKICAGSLEQTDVGKIL